MKVLISLLGKVPHQPSGGYRKVSYQFPDGVDQPTAFLGWSLYRKLQPGHLVIIGTETSMWDHLFEGDLNLADEAENRRLELQDLADRDQAIPEDLLNRLAPVLSEHLGCRVSLLIVPRGLDPDDQMQMFQILSDVVDKDDELIIDCTHGFRHMPMLLLAGAQFLEGLGRARVSAVYYGLLEPGSNEASVCRLDSLAQIERGIRALEHFDASGDYQPMIELMAGHLPSELSLDKLRQAAFHERTLRIPQARKNLIALHQYLTNAELPFPLTLMREPLLDRLAWATEPTHHQRQLAASRIALSRRDYPRSAALLFEAAVNQVVRNHALGDPENMDVRERARKFLDDDIKEGKAPKQIRLLRRLRNAMAHGVRPSGADAQAILDSEQKLQEFLENIIRDLE